MVGIDISTMLTYQGSDEFIIPQLISSSKYISCIELQILYHYEQRVWIQATFERHKPTMLWDILNQNEIVCVTWYAGSLHYR